MPHATAHGRIGATAGALALTLLALFGIVTSTAHAEVGTVSVDNLRTGWDSDEPGLSPASVQASDFGRLFATQLDGQIYAQPLSVGGVLIVATENDKVYGLDAATGAIRWTRDVGPSWPASAIGCGDLVPNIGVTSTPVYDPATDAVYFTSKVDDGPDQLHPHYYLHAVDPADGAERAGFPVTITGSPEADPSLPFDAAHQLQRPGLLLLDGVVYLGFGAHCDFGPYRGYVVGVSTSTARITSMWATEMGASNDGGGIWAAGGGLVSDGPGRIFLATGNGINPPTGPGSSPPGTLSESVVRLQVGPDGDLAAADFFSPSDAPTLDLNDTDLGSGGGMGLPDGFGTAAHPHLLVQQGKDGRVFLLDRDQLGGRSQGPGGSDAVVGSTGPFQGQWGHPAFWGGDGGYVYLVDNGSPLRALKYGVTGDGRPALTATGTSKDSFPYTSGSPVVTSTGTASGSALVWVVQSGGPTGEDSTLRAYRPVPDADGTLDLVWSAPIGTASKFSVPATDGGRLYLGNRDGLLMAFGRPAATAVNGSPVDFGGVAVGATGRATATLTATRTVTLTGLTASAPFGVTPPALPLQLTAGQQLTVPVTFSPTSAGSSNGVLQAVTDAGSLGLGLTGTGTRAGLLAAPAQLAFEDEPTGSNETLNVQISNTGTAPETITSAQAPAAPFSTAGLPAVGSTVAPGASLVVSVSYAPTAARADSSALVLGSTSGTLTVPVSGQGVAGQGQLVFNPPTLSFGSLAVGGSRTAGFDLTNTGNLPVTISKAKAPDSDFSSTDPLAEGLVIGPGQVVHQTVTFTPTAPGAQTATYEVTGDAGQGAMLEQLTGAGTGTLPAPAPAAGPGKPGWTANGSAVLPGDGSVSLTPATTLSAGSSFYDRPVPSAGLTAAFTAALGPGTGADGEGLMLLDASRSTPAGLGVAGGGLGSSGLPGISVDLVTSWNTQVGSGNFVGVSAGGTGDNLSYLATAPVPTNLRSGTHRVVATVSGTRLTVSVDGTQLLDTTPPLPASVFPGFTAATGAGADAHRVSDISISTGPPAAVGTTVPGPTDPSWTRNGQAALDGDTLALTTAASGYGAGSSFYPTPVPSAGLHASFTVRLGGGTGGDGLALVLLDPARADATALGQPGSGLGFVGLPGTAVALTTSWNGAVGSGNFLGFTTSAPGASGDPVFLATAVAPTPLRTGTHLLTVDCTGGHLLAALDGTPLLDRAVALPPTVLLGFTGANGGSNDDHLISAVSLTAGPQQSTVSHSGGN
ncbi:choice-of-anchor D domain-containing protein [Streptacidiphilus sp. N1-12]|uniref:Choice-of-anchor D domain-containing protein n=2 Tax=Streptacidiphilus alkalitolerans TaxID=3342712 RepID=A0ABV6VDQ5_9ACTN